jgi:hypothetical protein
MKTLAKEHGLFGGIRGGTPTDPVWTLQSYSNGWRILSPGGLFVSETYFDLAGLSQREKTLFFEGATVQDMINPFVANQAAGDSIILVDLMSTKPLNDTELSNFYLYGNFANVNAVLTFEETVYARFNQYTVDIDTTAWGSMIQVSSNQIGSLKATASDRIYSYRILICGTPFTATKLDLLACRHLLRAEAKEEAEYQYLMRLRRSYELQQSHDED